MLYNHIIGCLLCWSEGKAVMLLVGALKTDLRDSSIELWSKNCSKRSWILNMNAVPHSFYYFFYLLKNVTYSNLQQRKEIKRHQYVWKSFFFPTKTERPRSARKKQSDVFVFAAQWKKQTAVTEKKRDFQAERFANGRKERKRHKVHTFFTFDHQKLLPQEQTAATPLSSHHHHLLPVEHLFWNQVTGILLINNMLPNRKQFFPVCCNRLEVNQSKKNVVRS